MKTRITVLLCGLAFASSVFSFTQGSLVHAEGPSAKKNETISSVTPNHDTDDMRIQGELRYRANCGRCHAAPRKFPPRMMATVLRHMRVRATITDEDMRLVLFYMTQ